MTTARAVYNDVSNFLDFLRQQEVAAFTNVVSLTPARVSWTPLVKDAPFITNRGDPGLEDYRAWVTAGAYSAVLFDGALLQITYDLEGGEICGHRLAYVPCPYRIDPQMLLEDPILDIIDLHAESDPTSMVLHSTIRFDFDPEAAAPGHPAAHMTINTMDCRIACAAPWHVGRFGDFIFRHFYPRIWQRNASYFHAGARREAGKRVITDDDRLYPHIAW